VTIERVSDPDDPRLDDYRHLRDPTLRIRTEQARGVFTVEGRLSVQALLSSGHAVRSVLVDERRIQALTQLLAGARAPVYAVPHEVVGQVSGFAFHRGLLAAADRPTAPPVDEVVGAATRLLVVEGVNDFENLGSLYRNAAAFGVDAVLLDPTAADPLYRRVVRVSLGHVLRIATARVDTGEWPAALTRLDRPVLALTPSGDVALAEVSALAPQRWAVLVGAEGPGLSPGALGAATHRIRIPMAVEVDSVNVATAAAIALYTLSIR
jgi:tRNA G18 (ribose-2'-O)-methylase SpoU